MCSVYFGHEFHQSRNRFSFVHVKDSHGNNVSKLIFCPLLLTKKIICRWVVSRHLMLYDFVWYFTSLWPLNWLKENLHICVKCGFLSSPFACRTSKASKNPEKSFSSFSSFFPTFSVDTCTISTSYIFGITLMLLWCYILWQIFVANYCGEFLWRIF